MYQPHRTSDDLHYLFNLFSLTELSLRNVLGENINAYEVHRERAFKRMTTEARTDLRRELIAYAHTLQPIRRRAFMKQHRLLPLVGGQ